MNPQSSAGAGTGTDVRGQAGPMYSVWLMPAQPLAAQLAAAVKQLAPVFGTPPFTPHATLQGDLRLPLKAVAQHCERIAAALPVQRWSARGIEMSEVYFRSFYVALDAADAFTGAVDRLVTLTGTRTGVSPFPHVSLAYGPLDDSRKHALRATIAAWLPPVFEFDHLVVALAGSSVGTPSWRALQSFPLSA